MKTENITVNENQRLYVIPCGNGFSCLGFDVCRERVERLALDLRQPLTSAAPGTLELYAEHERLTELARVRFEQTGQKTLCELSPQLSHLKGRRVEVVTCYGETRRFWVGQSTGVIPINLEIHNSRSTGGTAADREYKSVRVVR